LFEYIEGDNRVQNTKLKIYGAALPVIAALLFIAGLSCSGEKEAKLPEYEGWEKYSYKHFVFHYPPDSYWGRNIESFSNAYERYLEEDCDFLAMEIPKDTIHFYIHDSGASGKELTGRDLPYIEGNQIHWDRVPPFGTILAQYLVDNWGIRRTDWDFLYYGLITLRDYSGKNYHHSTASLIEMNRYIPLDSLIDNEAYYRQDEFHRKWEGASFVGAITFNFGINRFKMLWQSTAPFDKSIEELFGMSMEEFEEKWKGFVQIGYEGMNVRTIELDSTAVDSSENKK